MLNLMLGAHSRVLQIGEAKRLRRNNHKQEACVLCNTGKPCSLFEGITPDNVNTLYDTLFERNPDIDVIVDNSKRTDWSSRFLSQRDRYDIKFIHLLRDPRALIRRWYLSFGDKPKPVQRWKLMRKSADMLLRAPFCNTTQLYAYKWLCQNRIISKYLSNNQLTSYVLTYHDLVTDLQQQLTSLSDFIGIDFEPQQLEYWNTQQHASGKTSELLHKEGISLDTRWQEYLTGEMLQLIENEELIKNYLQDIKLQMQGNGLTHV